MAIQSTAPSRKDCARFELVAGGSWDNCYEIAEFMGWPGQTYTIQIRRWSGSDRTWCGIAWTVTGAIIGLFDPT